MIDQGNMTLFVFNDVIKVSKLVNNTLKRHPLLFHLKFPTI
jgi:hypothetical protein